MFREKEPRKETKNRIMLALNALQAVECTSYLKICKMHTCMNPPFISRLMKYLQYMTSDFMTTP